MAIAGSPSGWGPASPCSPATTSRYGRWPRGWSRPRREAPAADAVSAGLQGIGRQRGRGQPRFFRGARRLGGGAGAQMHTTVRAEDGVGLGTGVTAPTAPLSSRAGRLLRPQRLERYAGVFRLEEFVVRL